MPNNSQLHGTPWSATTSGTSVANVTYSGTNTQLWVTDFSASSSGTMGTWAFYVGSGTTPLWQGSGATNYQFSQPIRVTGGNSVTLEANGTTATYANISGYYV